LIIYNAPNTAVKHNNMHINKTADGKCE